MTPRRCALCRSPSGLMRRRIAMDSLLDLSALAGAQELYFWALRAKGCCPLCRKAGR